jgi:hypothetical protein
LSDLNISVQGTPNPNAAKFTVNRTLVQGGSSESYFGPESAGDSDLAARLFAVRGVESLLIAEDFITVTKADSVDWDDLVPQIEAVIAEVLS